MAGNINNVIEKEQIVGDIQAVIDKILKLEDEIANTNAKSISISVDLKGAETISDLTAAVNEQREAIAKLTVIQNENKAAVNQLQQVQSVYGEGLIENVQTLVQQKQALAYVTTEQKNLSKAIQESSTSTDEQRDRLIALTKTQLELKQEVSNTTQALKSQIKEQQSAGTSMDNMAQKLGQLREQFRSLNEMQRNSPLGAKMQQDIFILDSRLKALDATIGNSQRNIGNYGSALDKLGTVTGKIGQFITRDVFRSIASGAVFGIAATGLQMLVEYFLNTGDAADKAKKATDKYAESVKQAGENAGAAAAKESAQVQVLLSIAKDVNQEMSVRIRAVDELQSKYPDYLGNLTKEAILTGNIAKELDRLNNALYEKALAEAAEDKVAAAAKRQLDLIEARKMATKELLAAQKAVDTFDETHKSTVTGEFAPDKAFAEARLNRAKDVVKNILQQIADTEKEGKAYLTEAEQHAANAAPLIVAQSKKEKVKSGKKSMDDELKYVKELAEAKNEQAKKEYDASLQTFTDEKELEDKRIAIAKYAYDARMKIIEEYHDKGLITNLQYLTALQSSENDENAILLKANEVKKKIDDEIHKRHEQADADSIKYIDGLKKQRAEIEKLTTDLENLKATNAIELRGAGFHLFGDEASNFNTQADSIRVKIKAAKEAQDVAASGEAGEGLRTDKAPDLATILKFKQERIKAGQSEVEAQHELDMLYADQKKKVQEEIKDKTIELAKETMSAIITIQENQFAKEAQMLAIKQQKEQTAYDQKKEAIAATAGYAIDKDNQLSKLAAQHAAAQNEIQQEQNQLALRKAKFEKQASIANIIAKTAEAEAANLVNFAKFPIEGAVIAGIIAATGAVELAAASSAPLPQFFKGGITETPIFTAGERGREMMVTPQGELSLTPSTTTVYKAPIGTRIFNNDDTERMIKYAANHVTSTSQQMPVITVQGMDDKKIVGKLEEIAETIVSGVFAARTPAANNNIIVDEMRRQANLRR